MVAIHTGEPFPSSGNAHEEHSVHAASLSRSCKSKLPQFLICMQNYVCDIMWDKESAMFDQMDVSHHLVAVTQGIPGCSIKHAKPFPRCITYLLFCHRPSVQYPARILSDKNDVHEPSLALCPAFPANRIQGRLKPICRALITCHLDAMGLMHDTAGHLSLEPVKIPVSSPRPHSTPIEIEIAGPKRNFPIRLGRTVPSFSSQPSLTIVSALLVCAL